MPSNYPGNLDDDASLYVAKDYIQTKLSAPQAIGDTVAVVANPTGWVPNMVLSVDVGKSNVEQQFVTAVAGNILTVTRAFGGTSASAHTQNSVVSNNVDAAYQAALKSAVVAIETTLGADLANVPVSPIRGIAAYNWTTQTPGGSLSIGSNSIPMAPVPVGLNIGDYVYISGGTGTEEAAMVTGIGANNIIATCANTHTGAWTIQSASAGIQEAIGSFGSTGYVRIPAGAYTVYGPINVPHQFSMWIEGAGRSATVINVALTFPLTVDGVFVFKPSQVTATNSDSGGIKGLTIAFIQPDSTNVALYTHWPPAFYGSGGNHYTVADVIIERAWDGITSPLSNGVTIRNVGMSYFHRGITIDQAFDILSIIGLEGWVFGLTINQTTAFVAVATNNYLLDISQVDFGYLDGIASVSGKFAKFQKNGGGGVPVIVGTNIDMDTNGGFEMSNGYIRLSNVNVSLLAGTQAFSITGGTLSIEGVAIFNSGSTAPYFGYNASQANVGAVAGIIPGLTITNLKISANAEDNAVVSATTSGAATAISLIRVSGAEIAKQPGVSYAVPLFSEAAGTGFVIMDISDVNIATNAAVAASAFSFASAFRHLVRDCNGTNGGGWTYSVPSATVWFNNAYFTDTVSVLLDSLKVVGAFSASTLVAGVGPNYIASETGANNAIVVALTDANGANVPLVAGLKISVLLAHSLQVGGNICTFNGGAVDIKSSRNPANNIATAYVSGGVISMIFDGARFLDLSQ